MNLDALHSASFKGVSFLFMDSSTQCGPKTVVHEYPNDSRRYVENLGTYKKTFVINAVITGNFYLEDRNALQAALEDGKPGLLVHPFYGSFKAVALNYTLKESTINLGEALFEITFSVTNDAVNPINSGNYNSQIISVSDNIDSQLQSAFTSGFHVSSIYPRNFALANQKLQTITNAFTGFNTFLGSSADKSNFAAEQILYKNAIIQNIVNPQILAGSISALFGTANNISNNPFLTGNAFQSMYHFGKNDAFIPGRPLQALERQTNNNVINYIVGAFTLMYAYLNFSQASFTDDVQLETVNDQLEAQYQSLTNGNLVDQQPVNASDVIGTDVLSSLEELRNLVRRQFDLLEIITPKIVNININAPISSALISYQYYGITDKSDQIQALNNIKDVSFVSGLNRIITDPADLQ